MPKLTKKVLTTAVIEQSKPAAKPFELRDAARPGMSLIVHPSGIRTWAFGYRLDGRWKKITVGRYSPDPSKGLVLANARAQVAEMRVKLNNGEDPARGLKPRTRPKANFVEDIWDQFVFRHLEVNAKASSVTRFKRIFKHRIKPELNGRRIESVEKRDVLDIIDEAGRSGPHAANSVVTVLSSFFNWCLSRDIVKISPMAGVKKPNAETSRERTLSDSEVRSIWIGCNDMGVNPAFASLVRLLILTGCRRSEVARMEWDELDMESRIWTIPGGLKGRVKNSQEHRVYLTDAMLEIIRGIPRLDGCKYVLTTRENAAISGFAKMRVFLDEATPGLDRWTFHDTRRTIASGLARLGVTLTTIERVLNHQSDSFSPLVRTYQRHDFALEMQKAWELWSDHVTAVAAGKTSNVVSITVRPEAVPG